MERLKLLIILLTLCVTSQAQVPGYTNINQRYRWIAGIFIDVLTIPRHGAVPSGIPAGGFQGDGSLAMDTTTGLVYRYWNGTWGQVSGTTPTLQQVFTAQNPAVMTIDNEISGSNDFDFNITGLGLSFNNTQIDEYPRPMQLQVRYINSGSPGTIHRSAIYFYPDSLILEQEAGGNFYFFGFEAIAALGDPADFMPMLHSPSTGLARRMPVGTAGQVLAMDATATFVEWVAASGATPTLQQVFGAQDPALFTSDNEIDGEGFSFVISDLSFFQLGSTQLFLTAGSYLSQSATDSISIETAGQFRIRDGTLAAANNGYVWTLIDDATGQGGWSAAAGGGTAWNGITDPTGDQALTFGAGESSTWTNSNTTEDLLTINSSTITTSSFLSLNSTSTALASGNNLAEFVMSGINGTSSITATGVRISVTNTGTTNTNVGLSVTASGGSTANTAISATGDVNITGSARVSTVTSGQVIFAGTAGLLSSNTGLTYNVAASDALNLVGAASGRTSITVQSTNAASNASFYFQNNRGSYTSYGGLLHGGSSYAVSLGGVTSADKTILLSDGASTGGIVITTITAAPIWVSPNNTLHWKFATTGNLSNTGSDGTAYLHLKAGTASASTSPIKLTSGTLNTTAEVGAVEFLTDKIYFGITTGAARKEITLNESALTDGFIPIATTNGRLMDGPKYDEATTFTPTLGNTTNVSASTAYATYYTRTGTTYEVWGEVDIDATVVLTPSELTMTLPISSDIVNTYDLAGGAWFSDNTAVQVQGSVAGNLARFLFTPQSATNNKYSFRFTFKYFAP